MISKVHGLEKKNILVTLSDQSAISVILVSYHTEASFAGYYCGHDKGHPLKTKESIQVQICVCFKHWANSEMKD